MRSNHLIPHLFNPESRGICDHPHHPSNPLAISPRNAIAFQPQLPVQNGRIVVDFETIALFTHNWSIFGMSR